MADIVVRDSTGLIFYNVAARTLMNGLSTSVSIFLKLILTPHCIRDDKRSKHVYKF